MRQFEPSDDFVDKVMLEVRKYERSREATSPLWFRIVNSTAAQWTMSIVGVLLGSWNIIRLYLSILAPVACR